MFIKRVLLENQSPIIFGDGNQTRDYIYVKDVVKAHLASVKSSKSGGKVFNISSGCGTTIKKLADTIIEMSEREIEILHDDPEEGKASRHQPERVRLPGELKTFILDNTMASNVLCWTPSTSFISGVTEEIQWILSNRKKWNVKPRV